MRRLPLALAFLVVCAPARAIAPAELIACFQALVNPDEDGRPLTEGRGQDLGRWEWAPPVMHTVIAVAEKRGGKDGFYWYGDATAEFVHFQTKRIPEHMKTGAYWVVPMELRPKGEGRGFFHCTYRWTPEIKDARPSLECDFTDREKKYLEPAIEPLKGGEADWNALKTAVMERIMSAHAVYGRRAVKYGESLERWRKRNANPPGWSSAAGLVGLDTKWYFEKPSEPGKNAALKALAACGRIDDGYVGSAARTEAKLIENAVLPKP